MDVRQELLTGQTRCAALGVQGVEGRDRRVAEEAVGRDVEGPYPDATYSRESKAREILLVVQPGSISRSAVTSRPVA